MPIGRSGSNPLAPAFSWNRYLEPLVGNFTLETLPSAARNAPMFSIKKLIRDLLRELLAPDPPPGALMIVGIQELVIGEHMHVRLTVGIPLLSSHEKAQQVKTRNFVAIRGGDEANPVLTLVGQDAATFTQAVIDNLQYGDRIDLRMFNVDQAGNVSLTPLDGSFVLQDTTPPDAPVGAFTVNSVEVADAGDEEGSAPTPPTDGGGTVTTPEVPAPTEGGEQSPPSGQ